MRRLRVFLAGVAASATSRLAAARASSVTCGARQHAGDFLQPRVVVQQHDAGLVADAGNAEMPRGARRHLRRMGDQQHLGGFGQALQPFAHRIGHRAAHAAIHFVEHQGGGRRRPAASATFSAREKRASSPPEAILASEPNGRAFHRGDFKGDALQPMRAAFVVSALQRHAEFGMAQLERRQFGGHRVFQLLARAAARAVDSFRAAAR